MIESGPLPGGLTFTDNGKRDGGHHRELAAGSGGSYLLTITATNAQGTASRSFTIVVF